jgi:hypothetical protein
MLWDGGVVRAGGELRERDLDLVGVDFVFCEG